MSDLTDLRPGDPERIGGYRIVGRLGAGGQGVVFLGVGGAGERVAVKQLRAGGDDARARAQLVKEVAAARLVAPFCTARVLAADLSVESPYVVSEYIEGPSLQQRIEQGGPMSGTSLRRMAIGTVTALAAIHQAGVVHRDLKPANVMLASEGPRVIDFGIARDLSHETTVISRVFGTPAYMAPEQLRAERVGPAADIFAWASVVAYAATGRAPFEAAHVMAVVHRITSGQPDLSGVPADLLGVLRHCLEPDPADRPSAQQTLALLLGRPVPARDTGDPTRVLAEATGLVRTAGPWTDPGSAPADPATTASATTASAATVSATTLPAAANTVLSTPPAATAVHPAGAPTTTGPSTGPSTGSSMEPPPWGVPPVQQSSSGQHPMPVWGTAPPQGPPPAPNLPPAAAPPQFTPPQHVTPPQPTPPQQPWPQHFAPPQPGQAPPVWGTPRDAAAAQQAPAAGGWSAPAPRRAKKGRFGRVVLVFLIMVVGLSGFAFVSTQLSQLLGQATGDSSSDSSGQQGEVDAAGSNDTSGSSTGDSDGAEVVVPVAFDGVWVGAAAQPNGTKTTWNVEIDLSEGDSDGSLDLPSLECSGYLTVLEARRRVLTMQAVMEEDPNDLCAVEGVVTLRLATTNALYFTWVDSSDESNEALGYLERD